MLRPKIDLSPIILSTLIKLPISLILQGTPYEIDELLLYEIIDDKKVIDKKII